MTKQRAITELLFAGALWGFGFVATTWSLQSFTAAELLCYRFLLAVVGGEIVFTIMNRGWKKPHPLDFKNSLGAGFFLGGLLLLQTIGLNFTTATNSGFITTLYVIWVPVIGHLFMKQRSDYRLYLFVMLALIGTGMLVGIRPEEINKGDLWTLSCSFMAAMHIIYIGKVSHKIHDSFRFNNLQSFWSLIVLIPALLAQKEIHLTSNNMMAWGGIIFLAFASSLIAFFIQVRAQKVLSSTVASMLFLLESPYAFLFGFLFLNETLNVTQFAGAILIIIAAYLTIRWEQHVQTK